ncbi:MAG: LPS export ABC transporter ATP-binding protein, partial [Fimbriimonadaceae bacterium]|nr:LPS export ABC transporter ATP-binding protein [Fimbriimonadaceae bacterium]
MRIEAFDLHKAYGRKPIVRGVSFHVETGEVVGLLGPNGAGKTTTFYMIVGLIHPNKGRIALDGRDIGGQPMYRRARQGIGYLPQETSVFRRLSVRDNMLLVLEQAGIKKAAARERVQELAEELHIADILDRESGVLSGGQKRRVEIARALATRPKFILLDEPFTGIDPVTIEELQHIILDLKTRGIGILITDHNVDATMRITDRNYILISGVIEA